MKVKRNDQFRGNLNIQHNMVQGFACRDRIPVPEQFKSADFPTPEEVDRIPLQCLLPTKTDEKEMRSEMVIQVERILCTEIEAFEEVKDDVQWHISHEFSKESRMKSETVSYTCIDVQDVHSIDFIN